jgi:hydroxyethylthiazole kinase-like sugar kinase family protein
MGLNLSKTCENALNYQAIDRLQGNYSEIKSVKQIFNTKTKLVDEPGFEPGTSTMPTWRSCQTDLLAQSIWLLI